MIIIQKIIQIIMKIVAVTSIFVARVIIIVFGLAIFLRVADPIFRINEFYPDGQAPLLHAAEVGITGKFQIYPTADVQGASVYGRFYWQSSG